MVILFILFTVKVTIVAAPWTLIVLSLTCFGHQTWRLQLPSSSNHQPRPIETQYEWPEINKDARPPLLFQSHSNTQQCHDSSSLLGAIRERDIPLVI
jgi:hypothetical protein